MGTCPKCGGETVDYGCVSCLADEVARLKRGEFTEEELQELCHNLGEEDADAFFAGCCQYQHKLFGDTAVARALERAAAVVEAASPSIGEERAAELAKEIRALGREEQAGPGPGEAEGQPA